MRGWPAVLILSAFLIGVASSGRADYSCETAAQANGNPRQCRCAGSDDCSQMRKSDSCNSAVTCGAVGSMTVCHCDAKGQIGSSTLKLKNPVGKSQK